MNVNKAAGKYSDIIDKINLHSYLTVTDNKKLSIDYCRKILRFDENLIELELAHNNLKIIGLNLSMKNFGVKSVLINGSIHSLTFESKSDNQKGE